MKKILLCLGVVLIVGWSSCGAQKMNVKFTFTNASNHPLNWVTLEAGKGKGEMTAGILSPGISSTEWDVDWSKAPNEAKLTFIDDKTRQKYAIPLSLTNINAQVRSGQCRAITLRILDYDKAEVLCK